MVECARYMTVAVIAAQAVHSAFVNLVCVKDALVVVIYLLLGNVQLNILITLSESEIINRNIVRPGKIMDDTV